MGREEHQNWKMGKTLSSKHAVNTEIVNSQQISVLALRHQKLGQSNERPTVGVTHGVLPYIVDVSTADRCMAGEEAWNSVVSPL